MVFSCQWIKLKEQRNQIYICIFRWLLAQGRLEEAENIVRKIAKYNGNPLPSDFHLTTPPSDDQQAKTTGGIFTFLNLFKTPNMRMKTLIIYYCWFTTAMIYYGLTLNSNNVGGSLFQIYCFGKGDFVMQPCFISSP